MTMGWTREIFLILLVNFLAISVDGGNYDDNQGAHTISMGNRKMEHGKASDLFLYHDTVKVEGNLLPVPTVQEHEFCFPPKDIKRAKLTITAFDVTDVKKGGSAFIKNRTGIGKKRLCLRLKSQRGRGYMFDINIYGYYN